MHVQSKFRAAIAGTRIAASAMGTALGTQVAAAPVGNPVLIVAHTDIAAEDNPFESSLDDCPTGTVSNANFGAHFAPVGRRVRRTQGVLV